MANPQLEAFGPYNLLGEISRGGMAEVHYAIRREPPSAEVQALKRILPEFARDPNYRKFFEAECELTRHFNHPNVIRALDAGSILGALYLTLEYVHGRGLNRILQALAAAKKRLPLPHAVYVAVQVLEGLAHVHQAQDARGQSLNVVLCDISPSNVMVSYDGRVKLIDFGIATSRIKFFEQIGFLKGKKQYMAPEQLRGLPLDSRADLFSIGLCLLELVTGQPVFAGNSEFEVEEAVRNAALPNFAERLKNVPEALGAVIRRAVEPEPNDRYATAGEFADVLRPFARMGKGGEVGAQELSQVLHLYLPSLIRQDDQKFKDAQGRRATPVVERSLDSEAPTFPGRHPARKTGDR